MNYQPVTAGNQTNPSTGFQDKITAEKAGEEIDQQYVLFPVWSSGSTILKTMMGMLPLMERSLILMQKSLRYKDLSAEFEDCSNDSINEVNAAGTIVPTVGQNSPNSINTFSAAGPSNDAASPTYGKSSFIYASQLPDGPDMPELEDITYSDDEDNVGVEADFNNLERLYQRNPKGYIKLSKIQVRLKLCRKSFFNSRCRKNKKDERGIVIRNKARLVIQGHTQEKGIDYKEVFAPATRIEAIRLFLAYASFMGFMVYQMDVKSAFLYGTIKEKVYVCQPSGFEDLDHPDKVYKVVKALYGLHQAPRACQDKYVAEILRKFRLTEGKSASTPIDTEKPLLKDPDGEDVDVHTYSYSHLLGVNTPRSDEDRLELMELMVFLLPKVKKVGIEVNAIDLQIWTTVAVKQVNDVTRLQALVDKKKVVVTKATIKYALTMNPNIYVSYIKQFWTTVAVKQEVDEEGDADENIKEVNAGDAAKDETEPAEVQEVVDVVTTAKLITEVVTAASEIVTAASVIITTAEAQVPAATLTAAPVRVVATSSRRRKGVVIRDPKEESITSTIITAETKSKDKGKGILVEEPKPLKKAKEDPAVKRYQAMKRKPQNKAQARKNMMMYLKNVAGFKMDYFKGMSYDDIRLIFEAKFNSNVAFLLKTKEQIEEDENRALQKINETPAERAAKR
nr:putative ribonuclease H-like domain-containing protein [Tanacetum cinerariifolium]